MYKMYNKTKVRKYCSVLQIMPRILYYDFCVFVFVA